MGSKGKDAVDEARTLANAQMTDYEAQTATAKASVEKQKQAYKDIAIENPYANMQNQYAENVFEDLTVNQQQAQFQAQQGQQQRANIMQGLRGAAGGSGIAGLAQAMANQGQLQTQQISASIGQQESLNQKLRAQGAQQVQVGAAAVDLQRRQGEAMVTEAETGRQATLLGMEYGQLQSAQAGVQAAYGNQMSVNAMELERIGQNKALTGQIIGGVLGAAGTAAAGGLSKGGALGSDRRLKKNINKTGESPSGLNIYSFEYKDSKYGEGLFQGVMSDEIPQTAVSSVNGYDHVDYSMLDVEFKQI
tara:strand:- start:1308 stop:2222 length:915 start_codon:yes stop_codon:yes gene_type:complete